MCSPFHQSPVLHQVSFPVGCLMLMFSQQVVWSSNLFRRTVGTRHYQSSLVPSLHHSQHGFSVSRFRRALQGRCGKACFVCSIFDHGLQNKKEHEESADDFDSFVRSMVTAYAILLGDFESGYVFDGTNRYVKGAFVLLFQVLMSITVLNLLIAVMTEAYAWVCISYNENRRNA